MFPLRALVRAVSVVVVGVVWVVSAGADDGPKTKVVRVGDQVPDFTVHTLDGKTVKLSELRKSAPKTGIVVLSFWCSTCHSCRHVEEHLAKLAKDYQGKAAVLALDANANESAATVAAFAKKKGLTMPIVLDPEGRTADIFGIDKTTTTVVIDGNRVLRYCGQFSQRGGAGSAEAALQAVLGGNEVAVKTIAPSG